MVVLVPCDENRRGGVWCDPCIAPLVQALNDAGLRTIASCCGHGHRPPTVGLANGQWIVIARDEAERRRIDVLFPVDINGDVRTPPAPPPPPPKRVISETAPGWAGILNLFRKPQA